MRASELHPDDECLVAYLDDQLSPSAKRDVEQRLCDDATFRERMLGLQLSWDALDELPRLGLDPQIMATTMSLVAQSAEEEIPRQRPSRLWQYWPRIRHGMLLLAALVLGFTAIAVPLRRQYASKLRDLPVAYYLDAYRTAGSLEFLHALDRANIFPAELLSDDILVSFDETVVPDRGTSWRGSQPLTTADVEQALDGMSADELFQLQTNLQRFQRLSNQERTLWRLMHDALRRDPDADRLYPLLLRFQTWTASLRSTERAELLQASTEERIRRTRRLLAAQQPTRPPDWRGVTAGDIEHLRTWLHGYVQEHHDEILAILPPPQRQRLRNVNAGPRSLLFALALQAHDPQVRDQLPKIRAEERARLLEGLTPETQSLVSQQLDEVGVPAILAIIRRTMEPFLRPVDPNRREHRRMDQFLDGLPRDERGELMRLPPDEFPRRIRELMDERNHGPPPRRGPPPPWVDEPSVIPGRPLDEYPHDRGQDPSRDERPRRDRRYKSQF